MSPEHRALSSRGWTVVCNTSPVPLPAEVSRRYTTLPAEVWAWLSSVSMCHSVDETAWFLTRDDFATTEPAFAWNACEQMALEAAEGEADQARIRTFWDAHFPIALSVASDYDYLAVALDRGSAAVVHGCAPEWEHPSLVCESFHAFLHRLEHEASHANSTYPFSLFLGGSR